MKEIHKRKTITFEKEVYTAIQKERGRLMVEGKDINFTEMVNDLCKKALIHYDWRKQK